MRLPLPATNIQEVTVHQVFRADLLNQVQEAARTGEGGNIFNINIHAANLA